MDASGPPEIARAGSFPTADAGRPFDVDALLARVWRQSAPMLRERLLCLDNAALSASQGTLSGEARLEAAEVAHKLAGALGMFGFPQGTELAQRLEVQLRDEQQQPDGALLRELAGILRAALPAED